MRRVDVNLLADLPKVAIFFVTRSIVTKRTTDNRQ